MLGPLGGVTAAYMNFSLGFFVGGQVLAGILGSTITRFYGAEGKHGANYMQTMAASVAGMSGMAVLVQAMTWLGLEAPPAWQMMIFFGCIGMFGVGVGMLYTPIVVDRMQLQFPSGLAVANILRALTDVRLLRQSIGKLGVGTLLGIGVGLGTTFVPVLGATGAGASTIGAGMIIGARIAVPAIVVGAIGEMLIPYFVSIGWLAEGEPFRKIGFLIALGTILGAAIVDMALIAWQAGKRFRTTAGQPREEEPDWKRVNQFGLVAWVLFWAAALLGVAVLVLGLPAKYVLIAIALVFVFMLVNGISQGISDSNPISSAFVVTVLLLSTFGLSDWRSALLCGAILLIATSVGVDMQQDRSTGWRLKSSRVLQFRYQVVGITMGAVLSVGFASVFMRGYPVLQENQLHMTERPEKWQSSMTYKFVGAIETFVDDPRGEATADPSLSVEARHEKHEKKKKSQTTALEIGLAIGLVTEILRKLLKNWGAYKRWVASGQIGFGADFMIDAVILPSPYASSFGGFVDFASSLWLGVGGILASYAETVKGEVKSLGSKADDLPDDMSTNALVGGGLIAGDSLAALGVGIHGLLTTLT